MGGRGNPNDWARGDVIAQIEAAMNDGGDGDGTGRGGGEDEQTTYVDLRSVIMNAVAPHDDPRRLFAALSLLTGKAHESPEMSAATRLLDSTSA
jgi:hypothetical protein